MIKPTKEYQVRIAFKKGLHTVKGTDGNYIVLKSGKRILERYVLEEFHTKTIEK